MGCRVIMLTLPSPDPAKSQIFWKSTPNTQLPGMVNPNTLGPMDQRSVPRKSLEAVGICRARPAPQMSEPGLAEDRNP